MSRPIKSETKQIGLTIFVLLAVCFSSCQICVVPHFCFLSPVFAKSKSVTHYVLLLPIFCFPIAFAAFYQITLSTSANCLPPCEIFSPLLLLLHRSSNLTPLTQCQSLKDSLVLFMRTATNSHLRCHFNGNYLRPWGIEISFYFIIPQLCQCHPHPQNLWEGQQFFRIRYYTLRLAKSDVFTPKLWEAKWIVDEVTCILSKQKRINSYMYSSHLILWGNWKHSVLGKLH